MEFWWLFSIAIIVLGYYILGTTKRKDVKGKVVLITGGASGIGLGMARRFAALGSRLVIWDINPKGLADVEKEFKAQNVDIHTYICDVSERKNVYEVAERVKADVGKVDILINNAGIVIGKWFLDTTDEQSEKVMKVNTMAIMWTVKAFAPDMIKTSGHLVTIASAAGISGTAKLVDYCTSKHAAVGFMDALRHEFQYRGIRNVEITVVNPMYINTGMFEGTKASLLFPIMEPDYVVDRIMQGVLTNAYEVFIPGLVKLRFFVHLFPTSVGDFLAGALGINKCMDDFKGRQPQKQ